jgi:hypothetical protein
VAAGRARGPARRRAGHHQGHRPDARLPDPAREPDDRGAAPDAEDAPATARLREAGAVLLGKTTTPEFGWKAVTDNPLGEVARNPGTPR